MLNRFKIGHYTDKLNGTGCTVIFPPEGTVVSASVKGASPGTREFALLSPERKLNHISALLLTGGSAYGLGAAQGVVDYLEEQDQGYQTNFGVVPIVPAAVIFDMNVGNPKVRPTSANAREAAQNAGFDNTQSGCVGAGTGATVGKWKGLSHAMKGGIGLSTVQHGDLQVSVLTVVNSVGDILDHNGHILAGALDKAGHFAADGDYKKRWGDPAVGMAENTVLTAVMTNARLSKQEAYYLAGRCHYGIARRIEPSHTSYDGDVSFFLAFPEVSAASLDTVAAMAVKAVENSIIDGICKAKGMFGIPAKSDVRPDRGSCV